MRQRMLSEKGFERFGKPIRREQFLGELDQVIPWAGCSARVRRGALTDIAVVRFSPVDSLNRQPCQRRHHDLL